MSEAALLKRLMLSLTNAGARVFRNHVGVAWQGSASRITVDGSYRLRAGDVVVSQARQVTAGLCVGSSDLIGWSTVEITPEMVGRRVAVFAACEAKSERGRLTGQQQIFLRAVRNSGGIAIEARSVDAALAELEQQRRGKS